MGETDEQQMLLSRGFGQRIGFGARPVLMVIDLIQAFTDASLPLGSDLDAEVESTSVLMKAAHDAAVPVILSVVRYDDPELRDAGIWSLKQGGLYTLKAGTTGPDIDRRLGVSASDTVLHKRYASCFFGTDLVSRLVALRADTLIIAGCSTSGCVRATVVDALQTGFRPMVVREAVGDRSVSAHRQSLADIDAKYGDVVSLDQTLEYFSRTREEP